MLHEATEKKCYKKLEQIYLGKDALPDEFKESFDIAIASGLLSYNHMGPELFDFQLETLRKDKEAFIIFTIRESQITLGYETRWNEMEKNGEMKFVQRTEFIRYHKTEGNIMKYFNTEKAFVYVFKTFPKKE